MEESGRHLEPVDESKALDVKPVGNTRYLTMIRLPFSQYWPWSALGATLMIAQSFQYNAIFFKYTLVLTKFYHVKAAEGISRPT